MTKGTILVVDDEKRILHLLERALKGDGHQVLTAQTGHGAIALIEKTEIDLMIIDMKMPQVVFLYFFTTIFLVMENPPVDIL